MFVNIVVYYNLTIVLATHFGIVFISKFDILINKEFTPESSLKIEVNNRYK